MSEFKGTPGPWKWFTSNSHKRLSSVLSGKDGDVLYAYNDSTGFPMIGCNERDMALIAAAPQLLEALRQLRDYVEDVLAVSTEDCDQQHPLMLATSVISKVLDQ